MQSLAQKISDKHKKSAVVTIKSGDTVRVHQKIVEGGKERVQIFEGLVIRVSRTNSLTSTFTVRRIASGVGVEKTYLIHSPNVLKVEVTKRSKVRRNYLTYMRARTGKSARLTSVDFDRRAVNDVHDAATTAEEERIVHEHTEEHEPLAAEAKEQKAEAEAEAKAEAPKTEAEKLEAQPLERAEAKSPAQQQNKE
ncbi:MAG TPA: 50S ribosomal protein L19 [Candidatus Saccharimonadales bacterium]|nr:50S ribosomal protein L19 [Candidatus Saccharimonadales bacterium]